MPHFNHPTYVLDLSDKISCSKVRNAILNKEISVSVRKENEKQGLLLAKGVLGNDNVFTITVTTDAGSQTHGWSYEILLDAITSHCKDLVSLNTIFRATDPVHHLVKSKTVFTKWHLERFSVS